MVLRADGETVPGCIPLVSVHASPIWDTREGPFCYNFYSRRCLGEYEGEWVSSTVAEGMEAAYEQVGVDCYMMLAGFVVAAGDVAEGCTDTIVDATVVGNGTRLINHSCEPNCSVTERELGTVLVLKIFTVKGIWAGAEIRYDYQLSGGGGAIHCRCGTCVSGVWYEDQWDWHRLYSCTVSLLVLRCSYRENE